MALVAGCRSSADAIADDLGKTEEVEQQYSELLTIIQGGSYGRIRVCLANRSNE